MKTANYYYLGAILGPLNTLSRDEERRVSDIDPEDEYAVRAVICTYVKPFFESLTNDSQGFIKDALQYFLTTQSAPFVRIIGLQQDSPLDSPSHPSLLFAWIWKELFPQESFELPSTEVWKENNDLAAARLYRREWKKGVV